VKGAEKGRGVREGARGVSFNSGVLLQYTQTTRFSGMAGFLLSMNMEVG